MTTKYHPEHTWVRLENQLAVIGITDHAQAELGEIVYVDLPEPGDRLEAGREFGQIESTKTTSAMIAPISGEVLESNGLLENTPDLINRSPEENGWITKISPSDPRELENLMNKPDYEAFLKG
jgi:glycine cleavage system H protein